MTSKTRISKWFEGDGQGGGRKTNRVGEGKTKTTILGPKGRGWER